MKTLDKTKMVKYWDWFFHKGYKRFYDKWLFFHFSISLLLTIIVPLSLFDASKGLLLPTIGILTGLSFAWSGNALVLLSTQEIQDLTEYHDGGIVEYAYVLLTSILSLIITLVFWGLAGLNIFDTVYPKSNNILPYQIVKVIMYLILSISIRECWQVVMGTQMLLLAKVEVTKNQKK